ncbi:hypothetical protein L4D06_25345 [Enterovibrio makurazakiensis]|uniref:hypothetical protein n=1 Tax=Enterovibrio makurazakiensis TaxID=2910232 RepID=UPI003D2516E4
MLSQFQIKHNYLFLWEFKTGASLAFITRFVARQNLEYLDLLVEVTSKHQKPRGYIEVGGEGGMIFQTQQMWLLFLMSLGIPVWLLWRNGGVMGSTH